MPNSIALLAAIFFFMGNAEAQQHKEDPCRLRFAVAEGDSRENWGVWPEDARKWWTEEGKKQFPELCETTPQGADFVIAWLRKYSSEKHHRPKIGGDWSGGPSPVRECTTSPGETVCSTGPNEQMICSTGPPQTTCTYEWVATPQWEVYSIDVERISVTTYRVSKDHFERVASVTKHGYDGMGRPGRASFRSAMKALKKKAGGRQ